LFVSHESEYEFDYASVQVRRSDFTLNTCNYDAILAESKS